MGCCHLCSTVCTQWSTNMSSCRCSQYISLNIMVAIYAFNECYLFILKFRYCIYACAANLPRSTRCSHGGIHDTAAVVGGCGRPGGIHDTAVLAGGCGACFAHCALHGPPQRPCTHNIRVPLGVLQLAAWGAWEGVPGRPLRSQCGSAEWLCGLVEQTGLAPHSGVLEACSAQDPFASGACSAHVRGWWRHALPRCCSPPASGPL